jgi:DNA-directed RNA polymerase beta subunit
LNNEQNYALLIIYFTDNKFRAYVKTYIKNKEINKNIELKIFSENNIRTYEEAILTIKEEINQIWKSQNLIDINTPSFLDLFLDINQISDYQKLRSIFNSIDLIDDFFVLEMTSKYTKIRLKYKGKLNKLKDKLSEKKINIKILNNIWRITLN